MSAFSRALFISFAAQLWCIAMCSVPTKFLSSRQLPIPDSIFDLKRCRVSCTSNVSALMSCRRRGCRVLPCKTAGRPSWKCHPAMPPRCEPFSSVAPKKIFVGCLRCPKAALISFNYSWPETPTCLHECLREDLEDVCSMNRFSNKDIAGVYSRCCLECRGIFSDKGCVCNGSVDDNDFCLSGSPEAEE